MVVQAVSGVSSLSSVAGNANVAPRSRRALIGAAAVAAAIAYTGAALAAPPAIQVPSDETLQPGEQATVNTGPFGFLTGISRSNYMLGDMWGLRTALSQYGISFALQETSEVLGNVTGGARQGVDYDGLTQMAAAAGHQPRLRLVRRHVQRQRAADPRPQPQRRQSADAADRERHRGRSRDAALGALVPAEIPRRGPARRQDRPAEPRPGIHGQPERAAISSTPCSAGRCCRRPTCPAAARPIRCRRWACARAARPIDSLTFLAGVFNGSPVAQQRAAIRSSRTRRAPASR